MKPVHVSQFLSQLLVWVTTKSQKSKVVKGKMLCLTSLTEVCDPRLYSGHFVTDVLETGQLGFWSPGKLLRYSVKNKTSGWVNELNFLWGRKGKKHVDIDRLTWLFIAVFVSKASPSVLLTQRTTLLCVLTCVCSKLCVHWMCVYSLGPTQQQQQQQNNQI